MTELKTFNVEAAEREFHLHYGGALAAWTCIESHLSHLFELVTRMPVIMASHIFFSARSFQGRIEMLEASVRAARHAQNPNTTGLDAIQTILKKSEIWSKSRNSLAHDIPAIDLKPGSLSSWQFIIKKGKTIWSRPDLPEISEDRVTVSQMIVMRENFLTLGDLIMAIWSEMTWPPAERLREIREQVMQLPKLPYSR